MSRSMNAFAGASSSEDSDSGNDNFLHPSTDPHDGEFGDFNPRKRRRTGRDAKESAALGIFGSESEDEGPGQRWKKKNIRGKGMSFVSAGQKATAEDEDEDEDDAEEEDVQPRLGLGQASLDTNMQDADEDDDEQEDVAERPRFGMSLGAGTSSIAKGFPNPAMRHLGGGLGLGSSPLGKGFVPSSETVPILNSDLENERPSPSPMARPSAFSTPTPSKSRRGESSQKPPSINAGSFAARMMAKMGYQQGQGLGKEGQGRSGVIEVQLRPQGVGLGAVREKSVQEKAEERRQAKLRGEVLEDSDDEKRRRKKTSKLKTSGTESGASTPKRRSKPKYQSLPEIQRAAPGLHIPDAFAPILDMTGPGQKLLTSSSALLTPTAGIEVAESTELVEARKLARRAQSDLGAFVEEWKNLEERKAWIEMEILQQQQLIDEQQSNSEQMSSVANIVQGIADSVKNGQWDPVIAALSKVEELGVTGNDELSNIAVSAVYPFFRQAVEGWQPLEDAKLSGVASDGFVPALLSIRHLLGMSQQAANGQALSVRAQTSITNGHHRSNKTTAFESLMYTVWFPKVRSAITNAWDVFDPTPMQAFMDIWDGLLPAFIRSEILNQLVVRKLDEAVGNWNPKKKGKHASPLPHLWLFPWLQYLPSHHADPKSSTGLVSDIKRKFRHLIDSWDFKRGAIPGLTHWRDVLKPKGGSDQWTPLIMNHLLPRLAQYLRTNFKVAPQDQEPYLQYLEKTLEWEPLVGTRIMSQLLVDELFPMWMDVLHTWLTLEGVSYEEVAGWVEFWRSLIPQSLSNTSAIRAEWKRGEDLINTALDLGTSARIALPEPSRQSKSQVKAEDPKPAEQPRPAPELEEVSFRHKVEDFCMENSLLFLPQKSTLDAHGPVYRVTASGAGKGGVLIYFRADHVYAQVTKGSWVDLGSNEGALDTLLELGHQ